eukprot:g26969.t1
MEAANAKIAELEQERSRAKEKVKLLKAKELEQQDKFRAQLAAAQSENDEELQAENAKLAELEQEWRVEDRGSPGFGRQKSDLHPKMFSPLGKTLKKHN